MLLSPRPTTKLEKHQLKVLRQYVLKYSRITSISAGRLLRAQPNHAQSRGDRDSVIMNLMYLLPKTHIDSLVTTRCDIDEQTENILKKWTFFLFKINGLEIAINWLHNIFHRLYFNVSSTFRN